MALSQQECSLNRPRTQRYFATWQPRILVFLLLALLMVGVWTAVQILQASRYPTSSPITDSTDPAADVAIVLGAAVWRNQPSPVFAARIDYALDLLTTGQVDNLIFTGGVGTADHIAEAYAAATYAVERGASAERLRCETTSATTHGNLRAAASIMHHEGWQRAAIVSDPLHMLRAVRTAKDLGIAPYPAPTPYTRYRTWASRLPFLLREIFFVNLSIKYSACFPATRLNRPMLELGFAHSTSSCASIPVNQIKANRHCHSPSQLDWPQIGFAVQLILALGLPRQSNLCLPGA